MKLFQLFFCFLIFSVAVSAQEKAITGNVTSKSDGLPLPGVNVMNTRVMTGVQTDFDGNFSLNARVGDTIEFSFIGMKMTQIIVSEAINYKVVMEEDTDALEEVVVVGFSCRSGSDRGVSSESSLMGTYHDYVMPQSGQLTAGEINDLKDWDEWLGLMKEQTYRSVSDQWQFYLKEKIDVKVQDDHGTPVVNAAVLFYNDNNQLITKTRSDAEGKACLFKPLHKVGKYYRVQVVNDDVIVGRKITNTYKYLEFTISKPETSNDLDVMFTIDATGSMSDEMEYLKSELNNIMSRLDKTIEKKRVALTFYRDEGDEYVVRDFDFNTDVLEMQNILKMHHAGGGGDYEEAVEQALKVSMSKSWNLNARSRLLFLMLDAPPHLNEENVMIIKEQIRIAQENGIKIIPIVASGANKDLEFLMRFFSISTNGTYVFLTDDSGIGNPHLKPSKSDYKVEKLNDLIVRLIETYSGVNS